MIKHIRIIIFVLLVGSMSAQVNSGKIVYERKTNLHKRLKHWEEVKEWIKEADKIKVDEFELIFNDSVSCFKPIESEYRDNFEWATNKNTTYQYKARDTKVTIKKIWGEDFLLKDSLSKRKWKITEGQRNIAGYNCRKAIWVENDSSRVYAWYADEVIPGFGPESFNGLPGMILGLATEDGGTIYFAKKVEIVKPAPEVFMLPKTKKKPMKTAEFREQLVKQYGKEKWGKAMLLNNFGGVN
jgi:GLPGLI family protein